MHIIGLTGGIGSGKSTVAALFTKLGTHSVDMDDVARWVVAPGEPALALIAQHFKQPNILLPSGELNRPLLRDIIFNEPTQKAWLEALLHPLIRQRSHQALTARPTSAHNAHYALLVSPLLFEKKIAVDASIVIDVTPETQIQRASSRDSNTPEQIQRIMASQLGRNARNAQADFVIENNHSIHNTQAQVKALHHQLLTHVNLHRQFDVHNV